MTDGTRFLEREHKLDVDGGFELPDLQALVGEGVVATTQPSTVLEATYFDTSDLFLFHAGIAIRRRTGGYDAGWHLKLYEGRPGERTEVQLPLSLGADDVPAAITRQLPQTLPKKSTLRPVLRLRTERTATELSDEDGKPIGELADDRVLAIRLVDGHASHWRELEIEVKGDDPADALVSLEELLLARGARSSSHHSKLERGLDLHPARQRLTAKKGLDPLSLRLRAQVVELIAREEDVREGRGDGVHQMRVAVRRLRSCLRTFRPAFEESAVRRIERQLKWLGDLLGAERDAEVIAARIHRDLGELASADVLGPVAMGLGASTHDEIAAAHDRLVQALDSELYRGLLEDLADLAPNPSSRLPHDQHWLKQRLARTARRTMRLIKRAKALNGPARDSALHEVRKSAKHVRYAAETLVPLEGARARALAASFENLQEVLGEHHDAVVTHERLRAEGARAGVRPGENGFTYGVLSALEAGRATTAEAKIVAASKGARRNAKWWLHS